MESYEYQQTHAYRKRRFPRFIYLLLLLLFGGLSFFFGRKTAPRVISPIPENVEIPFVQLPQIFTQKKNPDELKKRIQAVIGNAIPNYSVYVKDLTSDFSAGINETVIYSAASVNKIPILATLYFKEEKREVDFDKIVTLQQEDIQDYGTGSIRYDPPGSTYSVKTLAKLMMQKSDNTAAYLLASYIVQMDEVQNLTNAWGLTQTDMVNNKTSNKDMALLMEKIYREQIANKANTQEMLAFLKDSDFEDRLPALLPKDATVYHKIGTAPGALHDVGIIVNGKTVYYIGVFTSDIVDEAQTAQLIAKVSKEVYAYMK